MALLRLPMALARFYSHLMPGPWQLVAFTFVFWVCVGTVYTVQSGSAKAIAGTVFGGLLWFGIAWVKRSEQRP